MPFYVIAILLLIIAGLVMGFVSPILLIGYIPGMLLGTMLALATVKSLGKKSQQSLVFSTLFFKLTRYRATIYKIERELPKVVSTTVYGEANDFADIVDVLQRQMKFPSSMAKDASQYAMEIAKDKPLQEKIREALQYIDNGVKKAVED